MFGSLQMEFISSLSDFMFITNKTCHSSLNSSDGFCPIREWITQTSFMNRFHWFKWSVHKSEINGFLLGICHKFVHNGGVRSEVNVFARCMNSSRCSFHEIDSNDTALSACLQLLIVQVHVLMAPALFLTNFDSPESPPTHFYALWNKIGNCYSSFLDEKDYLKTNFLNLFFFYFKYEMKYCIVSITTI